MSDIIFVTAKIGGGKSLYATRCVLEELRTSERYVVTNLPLCMTVQEVDEGHMTVGEWCHKYVEKPVDLPSRLLVLDHIQAYRFWCHYPGVELPLVEMTKPSEKDGRVVMKRFWGPDLELRQRMQGEGKMANGTLFVIDEVHLYFGARDWQNTGTSIEFYMSQLRKLNDDLILISQDPGKVDKNFRRNSTEWIITQNLAKTRLLGGVSLNGKFRIHSFPVEPMRTDKPSHSYTVDLTEKEYHRCYYTMCGVGLNSKMNPESSRWKGRHWSLWVVMAAGIIAMAIALPIYLMRLSGKAAGGLMRSFQSGVSREIHNMPMAGGGASPKLHGATNVVGQSSLKVAKVEKVVTVSDVWYEGYTIEGGQTNILLTDGTVILLPDRRVRFYNDRKLDVDGTFYYRQDLFGVERGVTGPRGKNFFGGTVSK